MDDENGLRLVHLLREVTVELDLLGAAFARRHHMHPTDLRALIHLLDAGRAGQPATPSWLARQLDLDPSSVTALVDRLDGRATCAATATPQTAAASCSRWTRKRCQWGGPPSAP